MCTIGVLSSLDLSPQPTPGLFSPFSRNRLITTSLVGRQALYQGLYFVSVAAIGLSLCAKTLLNGNFPEPSTTVLLVLFGLISYHLPVALPSGIYVNPGFPLLMGALFRYGIAPALLVIVPSMLLHFWTRRHGLSNCLFNAGQFTLSLYAAKQVGSWMGWVAGVAATDRDLVTIVLMILAYDATNILFITGADLFVSKTSFLEAFVKNFFTDRKSLMAVRGFLTLVGTVISSHLGNTAFVVIFLGVMLLRRQNEFQKELLQKTKESQTDPLTGIYNLRYLREWVDTEFSNLALNNEPCTMIFIDVDGLKHINDLYGHDMGNCLLCHLSQVIKTSIRTEDVLARYGGDEFLVMCPKTNTSGGLVAAQRILNAARSESVSLGEAKIDINLSIGVASWPEHGDTAYDVIRMADKSMYMSKKHGGNRAMPADRL